MREIELKLLLDPVQERRLRNAPEVKALAVGPARTQSLHSIYYDTEDQALRRARIALRLRRIGRQWVQTVKRADGEISQGLSSPEEDECIVQGRKLSLSLIEDDDLREEVIGLARAGLVPVAETRFSRTSQLIRQDGGATAELAIDKGEVSSGGRSESFTEAELELREGRPADLYALAAVLFREGPVRFSDRSKSARALALSAEDGRASPQPALRRAHPVSLSPQCSAETAAIAILGEGLGHALPNLARTIEDDGPDGPHQLRVGLRRLRSSLSAFRPVLGRAALAEWSGRAGEIAGLAGRLRDLDVLGGAMLARMMDRHPDEPGFARLRDAIMARRVAVAGDVRQALAGPEITAFGFGFAGFLAARGWLDPADHDQTRRLAQPIGPFARKVLEKRWKAARAYGDRIADLTIDERHEMRKEIKKLRYMVDAFRSLYPEGEVAAFLAHMRKLQKAFGKLNDSAMAEIILSAPDAPGIDDMIATRAAGRLIGHLLAQSDHAWPAAVTDWQALRAAGPFWK